MEVQSESHSVEIDPLESVEQAVIDGQYPYERDDAELHLAVPGDWRDHQIWFAWRPEVESLHLCSSLEVKAPDARFKEVCELVARLNERLWLGHFDIWAEDGSIVFRHTLPLPGGDGLSMPQAAILLRAAIEAGDRLFPAFNLLIWGGRTVEEAVSAAMFDTVGEA
ncbi:MAG: YbjN domain-containing protein [Pseudomonadota bacterium]